MKIIRTLLVAFTVFALFYLIGAFYNATFNIINWSETSRFIIAFIGGVYSILAVVFNLVEIED